MNNTHPINDCPYLANKNRCTHKHIKERVSKRKRVCGYSKPEHCEMYCEWVEVGKMDERASKKELGVNHRRSGR